VDARSRGARPVITPALDALDGPVDQVAEGRDDRGRIEHLAPLVLDDALQRGARLGGRRAGAGERRRRSIRPTHARARAPLTTTTCAGEYRVGGVGGTPRAAVDADVVRDRGRVAGGGSASCHEVILLVVSVPQ